MLLRFSAQNYRSLRTKQELSLIPSSLDDPEDGLIAASVPGERVLPAVVIYGANASGKSNVIAAMRWMQAAVVRSHSRGEPGDEVPRRPFALDPACRGTPTVLDIDFLIEGVRYHYGFAASDKEFQKEWLYAFPNNRRQLFFERNGIEFEFGRSLRGRNRTIADLTRENSLFLSAALQNKHDELTRVAQFFQDLQFDSEVSPDVGSLARHLTTGDIDRRVVDFLARVGTGVVDFRTRPLESDPKIKEFEQGLMSLLEKFIGPAPPKAEFDVARLVVDLAHRGRNGESVYFDIRNESAGTRRLLALLVPIVRALDNGVPMIVDELDASLHTLACELLLALFSTRSSNKSGAQLIATTHDTNLLRSRYLRRDQVWFVEKDEEGATHLYPLTDIRTRKGDNLARGYLQGRYGAIPFAGSTTDLVTAD
jgi:hypothetical protein